MEKIKLAIEKAKLENAQAKILSNVNLEPLVDEPVASMDASQTEKCKQL